MVNKCQPEALLAGAFLGYIGRPAGSSRSTLSFNRFRQ
jgi:hypothetical protein